MARCSFRSGNLFPLGVWRSLVARSVRVGEVPSSNLGTPIDHGGTSWFPREPSFWLPHAALGLRPDEPASACDERLATDFLGVHDCGAKVLDVVEVGGLGDLTRLRRADSQLEPQGPGACGDGVVRVLGRELRASEDVDDVDLLLDLRNRSRAAHAEHLFAP